MVLTSRTDTARMEHLGRVIWVTRMGVLAKAQILALWPALCSA